MKHQTRIIILGVLAGMCLVAELVLMVLGKFGDTESGVFGGMLGLLVPAIIDAAVVEKRRRDPHVKALPGDVYKPTPKECAVALPPEAELPAK